MVDPAGVEVPNASLTVDGRVSLKMKTDRYGEFVIAGLASGNYQLRVQVPGFIIKDLDLSVEEGKETLLGRVGVEVKVHPCVGNANKPRISEIKLSAGGGPGVFGTARAGKDTALEDVVIRLLVARTSDVIATTTTDRKGTRVPKLRVRKRHALEVLLTWQPWPPLQLCL